MLHDARRQSTQIDYFECRLDPTRFTPRQRQETLYQPRQAVDLLEHASDDLSVGPCTERTLQRHLAHAADGGERGAKLVRGVRREPPKLLERLLEAREALIEHAGELAELVLEVPYGETLGQRLRRNLARCLRHGAHRCEHPAREEVTTPDRQANGTGRADRQDDAERPEGLADRRLVPSHGDAMRGVRKRSESIRCRPARRPPGCLVQDRLAFGDLKERDAHPVSKLPQIARLFLIDLLDRGEVGTDLLVQRAIESRSHEKEGARRENTYDERQHSRVP